MTAGLAVAAGNAESVSAPVDAYQPEITQKFSVTTPGHPSMLETVSTNRGTEPIVFDPDAPPHAPIEKSWYVNFESPPIDALALSADGTTLFAANTPNGTLAIFDVSGNPMAQVGEIPTGIEPVSVAIQPGTNDRIVWVLNFVSDTAAVVDTLTGKVIDIIRVGDEPATITFNDEGDTAFIVTQGPPVFDDNEEIRQKSGVVAVSTSTRQIVGKVILDMNTPRRSVIVPGQDQLIVAAIRSGNNTTVVGEPFLFDTSDNGLVSFPNLVNVSNFSLTQPLFADPSLSPWPDVSPVPGATFVSRIVKDRGVTVNNVWHDIVEVLNGNTGGDTPLAPGPLVVHRRVPHRPQSIRGALRDHHRRQGHRRPRHRGHRHLEPRLDGGRIHGRQRWDRPDRPRAASYQ